MGGTRGTAAGFSGGSGGAGGYRYQALAAAYVAAHALAGRPLNWIAPAAPAAGAGAVPLAVWSETGGPGDDLKVELLGYSETGNGLLEVQAKRGIGMGPALWDALIPMAYALAGDPALRCTLLIDYDASRSVRRDLKRDIRRLAEGRTDRLKPVTEEFLARLDAKGVAADPALLGRLTVVVADFVEGFDGEAAALALLARAVEGAGVATAWTALREDAMRLTETAGRWDLQTLWGLLESHGVRPAEMGSPAGAVTEDHVPPIPRPFIGREEVVEEIAGALEGSAGGEAPVVVVRGLPGAGKTAVAAAAAERLRLSFPDGVLWASVGPDPSPLSVLASWGRSLGAEDLAGYSDVATASARMRALLRDRRALLVLDDVWDAAHANPLAVASLRGATLATTRSPGVARGLAPAGTVVDLGLLRAPEAVRLIEDLAPSLGGEDRERLAELAERLGRLPLALRVAGGLLEEEAALGLGVEDLLSELTEGEALLAASVPEDLRGLVGETTPTVAALLGRSTEVLGETDRERFARLGAFAPGPATFDLPAAERVWEGTGGEQARGTMRTLAARGLVQADGSGRFSVHPVLALQAEALLRRTDDAGYGVRLRHALHYLEVLRSAERLYSAGGEGRTLGSVLFDAEWGNIRAGREWAVRPGLTIGTEAAEAGTSAGGGTEADDVLPATDLVLSYAEAGGRWISMRAGLPERALWAEDAIEAARLLEEADRDAPGARSGHRYQAARAHQLYVVAQAKFGMGDPDGALQFLEESAEIFRLLGDQRGRGRSVGLYGAVRQRRSEYGPAEENFRAALALLDDATSALAAREAGTEADPGEERQIARDRAMILGNLGSLLKNKGRADDAERAIGEAIDTFRKIGDTGQAAIALDNLGALRSELRGDRKGALRAFGMAKRILRGLGWRHDEAVALLAIGRERANAGEHAAAERTAQELLALSEELGDLSLRGWALALLGSARLGLKDPASAAKIYGEVLGLSRQTQDGRLGIMAKTGLGRAALPDDPAEALDHFEEGLVAARGIPVPLMVGQLLFDKAQALDALGRREEAIAAAEEAVASREELEAPEVSGVREWLAERRGPGHLR